MDRRIRLFPVDEREHINHAEPDQSLTIEQILRNVATTGITGLPRPIIAVYDDEDNNDFDDATIQPEFDGLDALDALESHRRNARSLRKQIDKVKANQKKIAEQNALREREELEQLRQQVKLTKSVSSVNKQEASQ